MAVQRNGFSYLAACATALLIVFTPFFLSRSAWSQTAPIKIIVPAPAGGVADVLTRLLGEQIGRMQVRTIVIENRPGATTVIGTEAVARAASDGTTLLVNAPPAFVIIPHLRRLNYDPLTSFEPVCNLVKFPTVIVVNSASPYLTLADLINAARAKPDELTLASIGPASLTHIGFEMLKRATDIKMTFVPYAGAAPAVNALLGNHVTSYFGNYADVSGQLKAGDLRALAVASRTRIDLLPDLLTIAEAGYQDYEVEGWFGLFVPAKTSKEIVSDLASWFTAAMQVPDVRAKLAGIGLYPIGMCGADFGAFIRKQYEEYGRVIRELHLKVQ
jgi:tripartite-type tricarboxylate transporter receptor subunit TctC